MTIIIVGSGPPYVLKSGDAALTQVDRPGNQQELADLLQPLRGCSTDIYYVGSGPEVDIDMMCWIKEIGGYTFQSRDDPGFRLFGPLPPYMDADQYQAMRRLICTLDLATAPPSLEVEWAVQITDAYFAD